MELNHDDIITELAQAILSATRQYKDGQYFEEDMPTAADMARKMRLKTDYVKKKLRLLASANLIEAISASPKRYRFNTYALRFLDDDDPLHILFCREGSPHYIED